MGERASAVWRRLRDGDVRTLATAAGRASKRAADRACLRALPPGLYWRVAARYYRWRAVRDVHEYEVPTDPFRILWVDPDDVVSHSNREYPPWEGGWRLCGRVAGGDWDRPSTEYHHPPAFEDRPEFEAFRAHFVEGVPWGETEYLARKIERVEQGGSSRAGETREEILDYWTTYDDLYESIAESGYASQRALVTSGAEAKRFPEAVADEVAIDVGRDGQLLFVDGSHRLAIAKLLDLEAIPTVCYYRHEEWMRVRESVHGAEAAGDLDEATRELLAADHPDLRDLHAPGGPTAE